MEINRYFVGREFKVKIMEAETIKLGLIDRLMKMQNTVALQKVEKLMIQAEMESRAEESLEAISNGDVLSIEEFGNENKEWAKRHIK